MDLSKLSDVFFALCQTNQAEVWPRFQSLLNLLLWTIGVEWVLNALGPFTFDNVYSDHHNHPHDHHTLRRRVVGQSSRITRPPRGGFALRCSFLESETPRAINHTCSQGSRNHRNTETTQPYHFPIKGRAGGKRNYQNAQRSFLLRCFWVVD